jgi:hypothetical protein
VIEKPPCFWAPEGSSVWLSTDLRQGRTHEGTTNHERCPIASSNPAGPGYPGGDSNRLFNLQMLFNCSTRRLVDTALQEIVMASLA